MVGRSAEVEAVQAGEAENQIAAPVSVSAAASRCVRLFRKPLREGTTAAESRSHRADTRLPEFSKQPCFRCENYWHSSSVTGYNFGV